MPNKPRRFERGTVLYFVNNLGSIITYKVVAQRGSTLTVHRPRGRIEIPDGSFELMVQKENVDAKEVDWGHEWYSDERKAVTRSLRTMKIILDYARKLPDIIQDREELLVKLSGSSPEG